MEAGDPVLSLHRRDRGRAERCCTGSRACAETSGSRGRRSTSARPPTLVSPLLLISDLGRPERFLNMLRVFKVTSPMSVGSWVLVVSGGASSTAAALELTGRLPPVEGLAEAVSFATGPPLATYTGTLLANTAIPVWSEARRRAAVALRRERGASAGAAAALFPAGDGRAGASARDRAASSAELGLMQRDGAPARLRRRGLQAGRGRQATRASRRRCTVARRGAARVARQAQPRAPRWPAARSCSRGELALRWSVFKAGFQSARDPRYTVVPQNERKRRREAAS